MFQDKQNFRYLKKNCMSPLGERKTLALTKKITNTHLHVFETALKIIKIIVSFQKEIPDRYLHLDFALCDFHDVVSFLSNRRFHL